jgi:hypothetical protein
MVASCRYLLGLVSFLGMPLVGARAAQPAPGSSPFLPLGSPTVESAPTSDAQIELRGIVTAGDSTMFSIYDATRHTSYWTKLNDAGHEFVVRSYDAGRDVVSVDFQGRTLTLALKTAKVAAAPVNQPQPSFVQQQQAPQPIGGPVVLNPTPADEQRRLEAIAAEVNRRRMIRQQAMQGNRMPPGAAQLQNPPPNPQGNGNNQR